MKTIFRLSVFSLVMAAFTAISAVSAFAQTPCEDAYEVKNPLYEKFRANNSNTQKSPRTMEKAKLAIQTGEEFVSKYGTCPADKEVVDFIKGKLPELKAYVNDKEMFDRFNGSIADIKTVNADVAFESGKQIMAAKPDLSFDVAIVLAQVGFDNSLKTPPLDKFNGEAINFAKRAIKDIEGGKTSETYGAKVYSLAVLGADKKTVDAAKSKQNALGWLNYIIASIMYYNQQQKKEAVPYFYQTTKFESPFKKKPDVYQAIGAWYLEELVKMDTKRLEIVKANGDKDNEESLAIWALEKGYADRAIDAYARAHSLAKADTTSKPEYTKGLYEKLQGLYKLRFDKTDGMDAYIATVVTRPMPDPATTVTPVVEETKPATTTTGSTTTMPTVDTTTKATTVTTKPAATTTTKSTGTTTKTTKTTTKKKGTR